MDDIAAAAGRRPEQGAEKVREMLALAGYYTDGSEQAIGDALCDLKHLAELQGISWDSVERMSTMHYEAERYDKPCDHYDWWTVWEDTIYSRSVRVERREDHVLTLWIGDGSVGDGSNDRICCSQCCRVFPIPANAELEY